MTNGNGLEANLLRVSSASGRAMEAIDRTARCVALYPALRGMRGAGAPRSAIANVIAASAEGYAFPTNLGCDQPIDGLAPPTQAEILGRAITEDWPPQQLSPELAAWSSRRLS